ncbi:MAG: substrate-binding domain-containing protein [Sphingomonadales bacterium]|nr:substrate-binding domain-containing protein [Sphingomonadales bacterium]
MTRKSTLAGLVATVVAATQLAAPAHASGPTPTDLPPARPGVQHWDLPTSASPAPQTEEEKKAGMQNGRTVPTPELLQPSIDPALPAFKKTPGLKINRTYQAGTSDVLPGLVDMWVKDFQRYYPGFKLEIEKPMAGSLGTLELIKGNLELVFVSRELKPTDVSSYREKFNADPFSVPISGGSWRHYGFLDAMAFMVHPDNPIAKLNYQQLDAAFSSTRHRGGKPVETWGDLGLTGEWKDKKIHLYGITPWNGFEEFIRQRVLSTDGKRGEWKKDMASDPVFFYVARRVANDRYALGYTGLSAIDSEVRIVPVSEGDGPAVSPSYDAVASTKYPLTRLVYLNTNGSAGKPVDPGLAEFLRYVLSREGQSVIQRQGIFLPLRAHQVEASRAYLASNGAKK